MARRLKHLISLEKPDIIHTNNLYGFGVSSFGTGVRSGLPVVHSLRDYYLMCPFSTMYRRDRPCTRPCTGCLPFLWRARRVTQDAAAVVGNSGFILEQHRRRGFFCSVRDRVIYNVAGWAETARPEGSCRHPVILGFLGPLGPVQGSE